MEVKILCPQHAVEETIKLPDGYSSEFEGEIPCNPGNVGNPVAIRIRLVDGTVVAVDRAK